MHLGPVSPRMAPRHFLRQAWRRLHPWPTIRCISGRAGTLAQRRLTLGHRVV